MSEHDANQQLLETARLRIDERDPLEDTQLMTFSERRDRAREAQQQYTDGVVDDAVRKHGFHVAVIDPKPERGSPRVTVYWREPGHTKITEAQHHARMQRDGFPGDDTQ